jgi:hypothetical protein
MLSLSSLNTVYGTLACCVLLLGAPLGAVAQGTTSPVRAVGELRHYTATVAAAQDCLKGQLKVRAEWQDSPEYDPRIAFIRPPDPVEFCVEAPAPLLRLPPDSPVRMESLNGRHRAMSR